MLIYRATKTKSIKQQAHDDETVSISRHSVNIMSNSDKISFKKRNRCQSTDHDIDRSFIFGQLGYIAKLYSS